MEYLFIYNYVYIELKQFPSTCHKYGRCLSTTTVAHILEWWLGTFFNRSWYGAQQKQTRYRTKDLILVIKLKQIRRQHQSVTEHSYHHLYEMKSCILLHVKCHICKAFIIYEPRYKNGKGSNEIGFQKSKSPDWLLHWVWQVHADIFLAFVNAIAIQAGVRWMASILSVLHASSVHMSCSLYVTFSLWWIIYIG